MGLVAAKHVLLSLSTSPYSVQTSWRHLPTRCWDSKDKIPFKPQGFASTLRNELDQNAKEKGFCEKPPDEE